MQVGDQVRTRVGLGGIPAGAAGRVKEVGRLFLAVEFAEGRLGYYARQQLERLPGSVPEEGAALSDGVPLGFGGARVPPGSHLCLFPSDVSEAMDVAALFLAAGLEAEERCFCVLPRSRRAGFRKSMHGLSASKPGIVWEKLSLIDIREFYLGPESFAADSQIERLVAMARSFASPETRRLRVFGYMGPVLGEVGLEEWWEYERRVTPLCEQLALTAICGYAPSRTENEVWRQAADVHPYVVRRGEVVAGGYQAGGILPA